MKKRYVQRMIILLIFVFLFLLTGCGDKELLSEKEVKKVIRDVYGRDVNIIDVEYKNEKFDAGDKSTLKNVEIYTVEKDDFQWELENTWTPMYFDATVIGYEQTLYDKYWDSVTKSLYSEVKKIEVPSKILLNIKENQSGLYNFEFTLTDFNQEKEIKEYLDEVLELFKKYKIKTKNTENKAYDLMQTFPYVSIKFEEEDYYNSFSLLDGLDNENYMKFFTS